MRTDRPRWTLASVGIGLVLLSVGVLELLRLSFLPQPVWFSLALASALVIGGTALLFTGLFRLLRRDSPPNRRLL